MRRIVRSFFFFSFCYKGVGKTVRYNDTRDANKRAIYCIIHQLFPIKTMCLMSASDDNLFIFFCGVTPIHLIPQFPPPSMSLPSTVATPAPGLANRTRFHLDVRPSRYEGICRHTELELLPVHLREEPTRLWAGSCSLGVNVH